MNITLLYISLAVTAFSLLILLIHYTIHYSAILRLNRRERRHKIIFTDARPKVSVIVVARNLDEELETYLPLILEQSYPDYEVILVNDGSWDNTEEVVRKLRMTYPHLYMTTIPKDSRIVSHRKLAITVGAKAAKGDILLLTEPTSRPFSLHWIECMVRNFTTGVEFVAGTSIMMDRGGFLQHMIAYDTLINSMHSAGFNSLGHPYAASGKNFAYLRSTFFKNDGFAGMLHQECGDDDLMLNRYGNGLNTKVETSLMGHTFCIEKLTYREWRYMKRIHTSTLTDYRFCSLISRFTEPFFRGLYYLASIASIVLLFLLNPAWMLPALEVLAGCYLLKSILLLWMVNATAHLFKQRRFWLSALLFDIFLPIISVCIRLFTRLPKHKF